MNIFKASIAALALIGLSSAAFAGGKSSAEPSVRSQILSQAKVSGESTGMTRPGLRLTYSASGKTVTAALTAMSKFNGGPNPLGTARRMIMATAKFKVQQGRDGKVVSATKQGGRVWQALLR